jgi:hypothetical protein
MGRELKGATLNREITCFKTIIRRAVLNRQLDRNPLEGLKLFKENPRSRTLTPDEYNLLLSHCSVTFKADCSIGLCDGYEKGRDFKAPLGSGGF